MAGPGQQATGVLHRGHNPVRNASSGSRSGLKEQVVELLGRYQNVARQPGCGVVHLPLVQQAETPTARGPERLPGPNVGGGR